MQVSYHPDVVDNEVMVESPQPGPKAIPSPRKIVIGRRKPCSVPRNTSLVSSNVSLVSGLSGSCAGSIKNSLPMGKLGSAMARVGGTATPNRGPGRFVSVNLNRNTGAAEVAKQTELVMKNLKNLQTGVFDNSGLNLAPPRSYSQTRDKENMPGSTRVQSNSPVRLPFSPIKNKNLVLNELTQQFSPSHVKRMSGREMFDNTVDTEAMVETAKKNAAHDIITSTSAKPYVSIKRMDVAKLARKNAAKQAVITEETEDENDDAFVKNLPMSSDAFQPTPARFSNGKKTSRNIGAARKKVAEVEETPDDVVEVEDETDSRSIFKKSFKPVDSRPSEADLGFGPPKRVSSPRAPSEMSEVTFNFKKPSIAVSTKVSGTKRKEAPEDIDSIQGDCRYLQSWIPRLRNKRLYVEGDLLDLDSSSLEMENDQRWVTSKIVKRVSSNRVATKNGTVYALEGQLVVRNVEGDKLVEDGPTPHFIIDKFKDGFPDNWEKLVNHWNKFNDQNSINTVNMSVFNSTRMTNMSMTNMTALENISSISANTSRFLTTRLAKSQLTINMGANLSILPEEEMYTTRPQLEVIVDQTKTTRSRSNKGNSGSRLSPRNDRSGQRSRSPLRSDEEEEQRKGSPQTERRSRSKTVRYNKNSTRVEEVQDKTLMTNMMEVTMSQQDFTLLRAKNYDNTVMVNKKKNYNCHFCTFLTPLFNSLKLHIKKHHLDEGAVSSPSRSQPSPRTQSNESVLAAPTPARPKPRRSSFSLSKVANLNLDTACPQLTWEEQLAKVTLAKNNFHCEECNFKTKYKSAIVSHIKSRKHVDREETNRSLSKKSKERFKSNGESSNKPTSKGGHVKEVSPTRKKSNKKSNKSQRSPQKSRSKSNTSKTPPTRTKSPKQSKQQSPSMSPPTANLKRRLSCAPGLETYVCLACDLSSYDDVEMVTHLMTSGHTKKVKTCLEKKFLSCNVCMINMNRKDDFIKHMRTKKHIKTLTRKKGVTLENQEVLAKSAKKQPKDTKKQSRFGGNIKKTKAITQESCLFGTPEEILEEELPSKRPREVPNSKNIQNSKKTYPELIESPRRKVLNPFKRIGSIEGLPTRKPVKSTGDIFEKVSANPKTVKQRQQNAEALKEYNENHEDDIFGEPLQSRSKPTLLKPSTKTLLSQDSDSDSEQDISVHSARTPMTSYFGKNGLRNTNQDRTPGILFLNSPIVAVNGEGFQAQAYIHKKVAEKAKDSRKLKKHKLATALVSKVISRTQADKIVDQSSQVINTITNHTAGTTIDEAEEGEEADDWFDNDEETNLSCDPGAGLLELLSKQPAS